MEFVYMVGMAGIFMLMFLLVGYNLFVDKSEEGNQDKLLDFGAAVQNEIILASQVHDGYQRTINIPQDIQGLEYTITNGPDYLELSYARGDVVFKLPQVTGSIHKGNVLLKNIGGSVEIQ